MKKGHLNKTELRTVATCYEKLAALRDKIPALTTDKTEANTRELFQRATQPLGELLRWQDYAGEWQRVSRPPLPQSSQSPRLKPET